MPDYDFYHGLYSGQQVDSAVSRALVGGQLDQDIAAIRAAVGSPLVANTAAEMTNINKIYVYTGSEAGYSTGHWYYYEGGEWNDGGLYNSAAADSAMSDSSTNAVQNKVIKEYVDDVRTDLGSDIADVRTDLGADILAEQTRAENVEALKAPLASPALTGTPTAPTAAAGTANTQIATTAYADNAVAAEKARAEAVEATKADQSFADYILLREEEDRQILFGSIVEAAEDEYPELRSSPIHNAITIGGSVYPRMDNTRMAIDRMLGRTVAFNQLIDPANFPASLGLTLGNDGYWTGAVATVDQYSYKNLINLDVIPLDHVIYVVAEKGSTAAANFNIQRIAGVPYKSSPCVYKNTSANKAGIFIDWRTCSVNDVVKFRAQYIDLTAQYGTTLAESIYAMEQATAGAGVAYVRQRLDLDYYASNSGELKAPVVSGVSFVGKNLLEVTAESTTVNGVTFTVNEDGTVLVNGTASARADLYCHAGGVALEPNQQYILTGCPSDGSDSKWALYLDADGSSADYGNSATFTYSKQVAVCRIRIASGTVCNNLLFKPMIRFATIADASFVPYLSTSLSLPSTRLDGVGSAQDYIEVVEDGENDYSLHLHKVMGEVDLGTLSWNASGGGGRFYSTQLSSVIKRRTVADAYDNIISVPYLAANSASISSLPDKSMSVDTAGNLQVYDSAYAGATEAAFKTAMSGKYLCYEKKTPTEEVIASHLTLAEISAIAENGGIISIVSDTGHIVQPDFAADVVISRSAS